VEEKIMKCYEEKGTTHKENAQGVQPGEKKAEEKAFISGVKEPGRRGKYKKGRSRPKKSRHSKSPISTR